jgi:hypothetical protein
MQSKAKTVKQYLAELPPDRRAAIEAVREVILKNLDEDYEEGMAYGMISYHVPHRVYPPGYHCDPKQGLPFAALSSQKHHMGIGLMSLYGAGSDEKWFRAAWAKSGKKLDMGKCCVRFKKVEDVPLEVVGEAIRRVPAKAWIAYYENARATQWGRKQKPASAKPAKAAKTAVRKVSVAKTAAKTRSRSKAGAAAAR